MPKLLLRVSWWRLLAGGLLVFAELRYLLYPTMRAGEILTPMEQRWNWSAQLLFIGCAAWLLWRAFDGVRAVPPRSDKWPLFLFAGGVLIKWAVVWWKPGVPYWLDPFDGPAVRLAYSVLNIGSSPGRGWEWSRPPFLNELAWFAVWLSVFGLECLLLGGVIRSLWLRVARIRAVARH